MEGSPHEEEEEVYSDKIEDNEKALVFELLETEAEKDYIEMKRPFLGPSIPWIIYFC